MRLHRIASDFLQNLLLACRGEAGEPAHTIVQRAEPLGDLVAASAAGSAHIGAASKRPYDGQDPHYSGCSAWGARMVKYKTDYYYSSKYREHVWVKAELWYSSGCRTVWTEVHSNVPQNYAAGLGCNIHRKSDGKVLTCNHTTGTRERNSPMLNDKNTTGYAVAWGHIGDDPHILIATTGSY